MQQGKGFANSYFFSRNFACYWSPGLLNPELAFQQKVLKVKDRKNKNEKELPSPEDNLSTKKLDLLFPQKQKKGLFNRKKKS